MAFLRGEPALGVEGGHSSHSSRGDRLPVDVIDDVAGGEDAGDVRRSPVVRDEVTRLVVIELVEEELGVRIVADRDEDTLRGKLP